MIYQNSLMVGELPTSQIHTYYTRNGNRIMVGIMPDVAPDDKTKDRMTSRPPSPAFGAMMPT